MLYLLKIALVICRNSQVFFKLIIKIITELITEWLKAKPLSTLKLMSVINEIWHGNQ